MIDTPRSPRSERWRAVLETNASTYGSAIWSVVDGAGNQIARCFHDGADAQAQRIAALPQLEARVSEVEQELAEMRGLLSNLRVCAEMAATAIGGHAFSTNCFPCRDICRAIGHVSGRARALLAAEEGER